MSATWADTFDADVALLKQAYTLCKCDLTTQMVYEFTNLQGVGKLSLGSMEKIQPFVLRLKSITCPMEQRKNPQTLRAWHLHYRSTRLLAALLNSVYS